MKTSVDIGDISLTTVQGYLNLASKFLIVSAGGLGAAGYLKTAAVFGVLLILVGGAQAAVGQAQQDAGKQLAIPPGGGEPELMDAHRVPDQPGATAVKQ